MSAASPRPMPDPHPRRSTHLTMRFGGLVAIGDLSFAAGRGDITALIGPNGAGKTTVFNCITGFYKPTEGMITLTSRRREPTCWSACRTSASTQGQGGPHLPEHPPVPGHDACWRTFSSPSTTS